MNIRKIIEIVKRARYDKRENNILTSQSICVEKKEVIRRETKTYFLLTCFVIAFKKIDG